MENTFFLFLADHGEMLYDHGLCRKESKHYDACIRVPLIIAGPGLEKGKVTDAFVQLEDICPTVMEATGQKMPSLPQENPDLVGPYVSYDPETMPVIPGRSLLPWCRGEKPAPGGMGPVWKASTTSPATILVNGPVPCARNIIVSLIVPTAGNNSLI